MRALTFSALLSTMLLGCGSSASDPTATDSTPGAGVTVIGGKTDPTYSICATTISKIEFLKFLDGNLVFVAQANDKGKDAAEAMSELVTMLVVNGLDFEKLADYDFDFTDGDYSFKAGDSGYTFSLFFAEGFGAYAAGDKIPYNVFAVDSYATNVRVTGFPPAVAYDHGPLWDMIDGSVDVSGTTSVNFKFKIHSEKIAFSLVSANTYDGSAPREADTLYYKLTSTRAKLDEVKTQLDAGDFGVLLDGSAYDSQFYGIKQTYANSPALLKHDDVGYFWRLSYEATVEKGGTTLYQTGLASQREANTTSYYCDAAHTGRIGTATHGDDLQSGAFVFEDGTTIRYGLEDF